MSFLLAISGLLSEELLILEFERTPHLTYYRLGPDSLTSESDDLTIEVAQETDPLAPGYEEIGDEATSTTAAS